jgi:hypothetical protein
MEKFFIPKGPMVDYTFLDEATGEDMTGKKSLKSYGDSYLYSKYPMYNKQLLDAIMQDPMIDKKTDMFEDVIHDIKRTRVSDALVRILKSPNTILLDCDKPLPKSFKVFCAKDFRAKDKPTRIFIDCSGVITKNKSGNAYVVDEMKLVSYLINAGITMIYHKKVDALTRNSGLIYSITSCFARSFTFIIDYLVKVSIQETSKAKVLYLSAMYFLSNILGFDEDRALPIAKKIAEISEREAVMLNMMMERACKTKALKNSDIDPYADIKVFVNSLKETMHFNQHTVTLDVVVERWMSHYGVATIFGMEYFPAFSAMMTDCYVGAYLNNQRSIENVCKVDMIDYTKKALQLLENMV